MKTHEGIEIADVYIHYNVLLKIYRHFKRALPKEALGFLLGDRFTFKGREWVEIVNFLPLKVEASESYVVPLEGSLSEAAKFLDKHKYVIVGWAHSHPGYGCFLSSIDIETQKRAFPQATYVALVMDPIRREYDIFTVKENTYERVHFKEVIRR